MKQLVTEKHISTPIESVWNVLTDVNAWQEWNPLLIKGQGVVTKGERLIITFDQGGKHVTMKPRITELIDGTVLQWKGSLPIPGLFHGEHRFELTPLSETSTQLRHSEVFTGVLVPIVWPSMHKGLKEGFEAMNDALAHRAFQLYGKNATL